MAHELSHGSLSKQSSRRFGQQQGIGQCRTLTPDIVSKCIAEVKNRLAVIVCPTDRFRNLLPASLLCNLQSVVSFFVFVIAQGFEGSPNRKKCIPSMQADGRALHFQVEQRSSCDDMRNDCAEFGVPVEWRSCFAEIYPFRHICESEAFGNFQGSVSRNCGRAAARNPG